MSEEFDFQELKLAERLPSPSATALAIMRLAQQEDASMSQLIELVKVDPALTSRILSFANSAAFGARRPVATVNDAVKMMGIQAVRNFSLSLSLVSNNQNGRCANFDYAVYWMETLAMAVAIAAIAARERTVAPEEAFTLGLLSNIGQLALATAWPDDYAECLRSAQGEGLLQIEQEHFAVNQKELTLLLLKDWGLPGLFLDALKLSFEEILKEKNRTTRFASQLSFARQVARYCVADDQYQHELLPALQQDAAMHDFEQEAFEQFIHLVDQQWHEWGELIDIKTDTRITVPECLDSESQKSKSNVLPGLDILLVDDDAMMLTRLSKQLTAAGHRVQVCRDGDSALKYVLENELQLIVTDWRMDPMDGVKLCKTLRSSSVGKKLYIIMLTAAETDDELVAAFDAGIDDYVIKPVNLRILMARIRAGQRISLLQKELEKEKQEIQRYSAELAVANRRLGVLANTDMLTSLPNRRYALERLEQEWDALQRYSRPISVLMLDLDFFKSINDTLGHDAGDKVLKHVAKVMKASARATDIVCRMGGEEFLVIATNTDGKTARLLGERIRKAIETHQPKTKGLLRPVTVSIGVAGSVGATPGWSDLIKQADKALYQVKAGSRNATKLAAF